MAIAWVWDLDGLVNSTLKCHGTGHDGGLGDVQGAGNFITASTCNSADYDTKITAWCADCPDLVCVDGNDDGVGCAGFTSTLTWCAAAGEEYKIMVHGFLGDSGDFDLALDEGGPCDR